MEIQDASNEQKPLSFENLDDIPDIDDSDSASVSTAENVTEIHVPPSNTERGSSIHKTMENTVEGSSSNIDNGTSGSSPKNGDKLYPAKIQEVSSCTDDISMMNPLTKALPQDNDVLPEECMTHSLSFTFRPDPVKEESARKKSIEKEGKITETQGLLSSLDSTLAVKNKTKKVKKTGNKDSRDSDSSACSKKKGKSHKTKIKSKFAPGSFEYIEERLRGQIFSGWIEERKWVETLSGYRDVIEVDEWEVEMNQTLMAVVRSIPGVLEGSKWINITPPSVNEPCYCLWTLLPTPPNPGHYWFSITGIAVIPQFGLRVMARMIRSIHPHDGELAKVRRNRRKDMALREPGHELETLGEQVQDWLQHLRHISFSDIWSTISSTITLSNIKESIRFVVVLSMTLVVGIVAFVKEGHHYMIQFIHAAGIFFRNITPFLQSLLAFAEKIIGGMYLLIAMVYKDVRRSSAPQPPVQPYPGPNRLAMAITDRQNVSASPGPRVVKYVPPEQWVYKSQNSPADR